MMRFFKRASRQPSAPAVAPEFGVHVTLRRGDRIVQRDARGAIQVTLITEDTVRLTDLGAPPPSPRPRRRA
jgi:hypothetical protein